MNQCYRPPILSTIMKHTLNFIPSKWNLVEISLNDGDPINPILITNVVNEVIIKKKSQK